MYAGRPFAGRSAGAGPDVFHRPGLLRSQAGCRILAGLADQRLRVEGALARIVEHTVFDAIEGVAGGVHAILNDMELARRNVTLGVLVHRERNP